MASSSRGLFSYSSEKAVKEGTLHLDQIKVYSVSFWERNCVLILRKVPALTIIGHFMWTDKRVFLVLEGCDHEAGVFLQC